MKMNCVDKIFCSECNYKKCSIYLYLDNPEMSGNWDWKCEHFKPKRSIWEKIKDWFSDDTGSPIGMF